MSTYKFENGSDMESMAYGMGYRAGTEHGWRKSMLELANDENRELHDSGFYASHWICNWQENIAGMYGMRDAYMAGLEDGIIDGEQAHLKSREENAA